MHQRPALTCCLLNGVLQKDFLADRSYLSFLRDFGRPKVELTAELFNRVLWSGPSDHTLLPGGSSFSQCRDNRWGREEHFASVSPIVKAGECRICSTLDILKAFHKDLSVTCPSAQRRTFIPSPLLWGIEDIYLLSVYLIRSNTQHKVIETITWLVVSS